MKTSRIPHHRADAWEWWRQRAWEVHEQGWWQKDIAAALGVSTAAVCQWLKRRREGGEEALHTRLRPEGPSKLTAEPWAQRPALLMRGAEAEGFRGDGWTAAGVTDGSWRTGARRREPPGPVKRPCVRSVVAVKQPGPVAGSHLREVGSGGGERVPEGLVCTPRGQPLLLVHVAHGRCIAVVMVGEQKRRVVDEGVGGLDRRPPRCRRLQAVAQQTLQPGERLAQPPRLWGARGEPAPPWACRPTRSAAPAT